MLHACMMRTLIPLLPDSHGVITMPVPMNLLWGLIHITINGMLSTSLYQQPAYCVMGFSIMMIGAMEAGMEFGKQNQESLLTVGVLK